MTLKIITVWIITAIWMALFTGLFSKKRISAKAHCIMWVVLPVKFIFGLFSDFKKVFYKEPFKRFLKLYYNNLFP